MTQNTDIDFTEDTKAQADQQGLEKVEGLVSQATKLLQEAKDLETESKQKLAEAKVITSQILPELMNELGLTKVVTKDDMTVSVKEVVAGSIPSQGAINKASGQEREALECRLEEALEWIEENGGGKIVKRRILADIGKDEEASEKALAALQELEIPCYAEHSVHHSTLNSWLKEVIANGKNPPESTFSLFTGTVAEIKAPRGSSKRKA